MSVYVAELDGAGVVVRVIVAPDAAWPAGQLGGRWVQTADPYGPAKQAVAYCGPGYRWEPDLEQFFPWDIDIKTGSIWVAATAWETLAADARETFTESTGLGATRETVAGVDYVVLGGRVITDADAGHDTIKAALGAKAPIGPPASALVAEPVKP